MTVVPWMLELESVLFSNNIIVVLTEIEPAPFQFHAGGPCSDLEVMICREVAGTLFILDATKKMYALFQLFLPPFHSYTCSSVIRLCSNIDVFSSFINYNLSLLILLGFIIDPWGCKRSYCLIVASSKIIPRTFCMMPTVLFSIHEVKLILNLLIVK
jgi:hypothetical protein